MDKPTNIVVLNWSNFSVDLVKGMKNMLKEARSFIVEGEKAIILEFNNIKGRELTENEIADWVAIMLEKYPKYTLFPTSVTDNIITCCVAKNK